MSIAYRTLLATLGGSFVPSINDFVVKFNTTFTSTGSSANNQVKLPVTTADEYYVDWGDGNIDIVTVADPQPTHTYAATGQYIIRLQGSITYFQFNNTGDRLKILDIMQWGNQRIFGISSASNQFTGCQNLQITATDLPDLTGSRLLASFNGCRFVSIPTINSWNFTVANSNVSSLFANNTNFNQALSINFSSQTNFSNLLSSCIVFNSSLNGCNFSNGTSFVAFLQSATAYNQSFTGVQFGKATTNTDFTNFLTLASSFNQPLTAASFPRPTNLTRMMNFANNFNSLITFPMNWVTTMSNFMTSNAAFSTANYDAFLVHANTYSLVSGVAATFTLSKYTLGSAADSARANIIATYSWNIGDAGGI